MKKEDEDPSSAWIRKRGTISRAMAVMQRNTPGVQSGTCD